MFSLFRCENFVDDASAWAWAIDRVNHICAGVTYGACLIASYRNRTYTDSIHWLIWCRQRHANSDHNFGQIFTFNFDIEIELRTHLINFIVLLLHRRNSSTVIIIMIGTGKWQKFYNSLTQSVRSESICELWVVISFARVACSVYVRVPFRHIW